MRNATLVLAAAIFGAVISNWFHRPAEADASHRKVKLPDIGVEGASIAVGGSADNRMDIAWVLDRRKGEDGNIQLHLGAYNVTDVRKGGIHMIDTRRLDWDFMAYQWSSVKPTVGQNKKEIDKNKPK